jgi:hypothetical protein
MRWSGFFWGSPDRKRVRLGTASEKDSWQGAIAVSKTMSLGLPWFRGQADRSHDMPIRLSIDDRPNQDTAPVHRGAKVGGRRALPH